MFAELTMSTELRQHKGQSLLPAHHRRCYPPAMNVAGKCLRVSSLLLGACLLSISNTSGQSGRRAEGRVLDESGGAIAGATVTLFSDDRVRTVKADDDGAFAFAILPPGSYYLEAAAKGFLSGGISITDKTPERVLVTLHVGQGSGPSVICDEGKMVFPSVAYEEKIGKVQLAGTVGDACGGVLVGTTVTLMQTAPDAPLVTKEVPFGGTTREVRSPKETVVTEVIPNERGEFQISGLEPGWYTLKATHDGYWDGYWNEGSRFWIARGNLTRISRIYLFTKSQSPACGTRWDATGVIEIELQQH
jgi:hypothetical protein